MEDQIPETAAELRHQMREELKALRAQRDSLLAALESAPDFGGEPKTAFGRQYRDWQKQAAAAIAAAKAQEKYNG